MLQGWGRLLRLGASALALGLVGASGVVPVGAELAVAPIECEPHASDGLAGFSPGSEIGAKLDDPLLGTAALEPELSVAETRIAAADVGPTQIQVYFHVISDGTEYVTDAQITEQVRIMNDAFAGGQGGVASPFSFAHAGTDRVVKPEWYGEEFAARSAAELAAMETLRTGDAKTLNVYVTKTADGSSWARLPAWYKHAPDLDGIVVSKGHFYGTWETYGSGTTTGIQRGLGDVAVHEVGHWLGLWHTFHGYVEADGGGGCRGDGDLVDDTPAQDKPTQGCPLVAPDTCPLAAGSDPIHNFMDYSSEVCRNGFTAGQVERMKAQWATYREGIKKTGRGSGRR